MDAGGAIRRGFAAIGNGPAVLLAEIAWRWCFAAAAWLAAIVLVLEYLNSIQVSWQERLALQSGEPLLALAGVAHALRGTGGRLAAGFIVTATGLAILWILTSAVGRLATLKALLPSVPGGYRPLVGLSFLRAGLFLAAVLAALGALILAAFAGRGGDATAATIVAVVLIACIWLAWALLNWLLSLATIFSLRDQRDTFGAVGAAVDLIRESFAEVVLTSLPFVLLHYAALAAAVTAGILIFDVMMRVSGQGGWALLAVLIAYFAYADFLYIARLASYVTLAGPGGEAAPYLLTVTEPEPPAAISPLGLGPESA